LKNKEDSLFQIQLEGQRFEWMGVNRLSVRKGRELEGNTQDFGFGIEE